MHSWGTTYITPGAKLNSGSLASHGVAAGSGDTPPLPAQGRSAGKVPPGRSVQE